MKPVLDFLSGKKTYLVGVGAIAYAAGVSRGWWPNDIEIWGLLGGTGAMTLRAAIKKLCLQVAVDAELPLNDPAGAAAKRLTSPAPSTIQQP